MIELQELLGRLQGVQSKGAGQYMARCPCHDDHRASLAVRMGEKSIVLHCLAGCATEDIVDRLGLRMQDLMLEDAPRSRSGKPRAAKAAKPAPRLRRGARLPTFGSCGWAASMSTRAPMRKGGLQRCGRPLSGAMTIRTRRTRLF